MIVSGVCYFFQFEKMEMEDGEQGKKGIENSIYDSDPLLLLFVQKMNSEKKIHFVIFVYFCIMPIILTNQEKTNPLDCFDTLASSAI